MGATMIFAACGGSSTNGKSKEKEIVEDNDDAAVGFAFVYPKMTEKEMIRLEPSNWIFFKEDNPSVSVEHQKVLDMIIRKMNKNPEDTCFIVGIWNPNCGKSDMYSQKLTEVLTRKVKEYMVGKGLPEERLICEGKGKSITYEVFGE